MCYVETMTCKEAKLPGEAKNPAEKSGFLLYIQYITISNILLYATYH